MTHTGIASYEMSPRNDMTETEDISMQRVGMRAESEKKAYESYTSRERYYKPRYEPVRKLELDRYVR